MDARYDPTFTTVTLDKVKVATQSRLSPNVAQSMRMENYIDMVTQDLVVSLQAEIYGNRQRVRPGVVARDVKIEVPASWWQAFKLAAVDAGNPFIDRDKIMFVEIVRHVEVDVLMERYVAWPDIPFAVPESWGASVLVAMPSSADWRVTP